MTNAITKESIDIESIQKMIKDARTELSKMEAEHTTLNARVNSVQAALFCRLRDYYQKRDNLKIAIEHRQRYLYSLKIKEEVSTERVRRHYEQARSQNEKDYEEMSEHMEEYKTIDPDQEIELSVLWKKLVKLYHPDHFASKPEMLETYHNLTAAINHAKSTGDILTLREIADDPNGYILKNGWMMLDFSDETELQGMIKIYSMLQMKKDEINENIRRLLESSEYKLYDSIKDEPSLLEELIITKIASIEEEIEKLQKIADDLVSNIAMLGGDVESISF